MNLVHILAQYWDFLAGVTFVIIFIVRAEAGMRSLRKDFDKCHQEHGPKAEERLGQKIETTTLLLQQKIETLIAQTNCIAGKISMIERHINGDSK